MVESSMEDFHRTDSLRQPEHKSNSTQCEEFRHPEVSLGAKDLVICWETQICQVERGIERENARGIGIPEKSLSCDEEESRNMPREKTIKLRSSEKERALHRSNTGCFKRLKSSSHQMEL